MANPKHLAMLKKGVEPWDRWREKNPTVTPDLSGAELNGADLSGGNFSKTDVGKASLRETALVRADLSDADLRAADLIGANLCEAHLFGADLTYADLSEANLSKAGLNEAKLRRAELGSADLSGASLGRADLSGANLDYADFTMADVGFTIFSSVNLGLVRGLETVGHYGPSAISLDTIYMSAGKIPQAFLRGAGVPENFIQYMASLVGVGIEFYSLFISYSTKDQEFAKRLHSDLQANGVRCWYAPEDLPGGKKIHEEIDTAIRMHDKLLLILSEHSMRSEWVKTEISKARKREIKEGRQVLFPIRLCSIEELRDWECFDADTGKDSAREIREYFIPDFSNWKDHDTYKMAFDRLLKDLQGKRDFPATRGAL
jgi:TIR domain-containing protein/pentapeptide repeat protein